MTRVLALALLVLPFTVGAQESVSRLSVHGYLTQAYGITQRHMTMGLTPDGTADYRRAALLARFELTPGDHFVFQAAHRRLGDSPTMEFEENIKLDMAFYEHAFATGTKVRVGKMALPWGIYNEVRYAGTLTPFYRAPYVIYRDGTYASETVDGASVSQVLRGGKPWEVSLDAYGGSFDQLEYGPTYPSNSAPVYSGAILKSKNALGAQLWLATPVTGLRVGLSARRHTDMGGIYERGGGVSTRLWNASVDGSFDRWMIRAEQQGLATTSFGMTAGYLQAGVRVLPWLAFNAQSEYRHERLQFTPDSPWLHVHAGRDHALGINFHMAPNMVLKLEGHSTTGYGLMFEQMVDYREPPLRSGYFISSFSVSF